MQEATLLGELSQADESETGSIFREFIRGAMLTTFVDVMLKEVEMLCGPNYHPLGGEAPYRSGTAPGVCILEGRAERVERPRVRRKADDESEEVHLASYAAAKDAGAVREALMRALKANVSGRDQRLVYPGSPLTSKSSVSRMWMRESLKKVEELRGRELSGESFFGLMLDGIKLSKDLTAVVGIGLMRARRMEHALPRAGAQAPRSCAADSSNSVPSFMAPSIGRFYLLPPFPYR